MKPTITIRQESPEDYSRVIELTERAFETMEFSDKNEGRLVDQLRKAPGFIEQLSLVAEINNLVIGHILFTPIQITNDQQQFESLILAPVSVIPEFQNQGIGSQLIEAGHQKAKELGFRSVVVFGHPKYYPRFGYRPASRWGIKSPIPLPSDDVFMAMELTKDELSHISGTVVFPQEFGIK